MKRFFGRNPESVLTVDAVLFGISSPAPLAVFKKKKATEKEVIEWARSYAKNEKIAFLTIGIWYGTLADTRGNDEITYTLLKSGEIAIDDIYSAVVIDKDGQERPAKNVYIPTSRAFCGKNPPLSAQELKNL